LFSIYSVRVLTRSKHHWSQRVSDDNPRGYSEEQKQRIANVDTLLKKRGVELKMMRERLTNENSLKEPIDDEYGKDRINAMFAEINAEYAAMGVNIGVTRNAGVVGTEDDEDEESDSESHESRPIKRYVNLS
jgi:DNA-binding transcriptional MerR regulator